MLADQCLTRRGSQQNPCWVSEHLRSLNYQSLEENRNKEPDKENGLFGVGCSDYATCSQTLFSFALKGKETGGAR
jgi:hypothetical protein